MKLQNPRRSRLRFSNLEIPLISEFPKGTLGSKFTYKPGSLDYCFSLQSDSDINEEDSVLLDSLNNAVIEDDFATEIPETDSGETLKALGYYDSADKRSCCRKKRE